MADERTHSACRWSRLRALLRRDAGFALIEVVVSAGLVMVIAAAVLGGIDVPSRISGDNQATSQASALAQQDQERMRSLPISQLINYTNTASKTVDAHSYTVDSKVTWVTDSGSTVTCASTDTTSGDYLKLESKITGGGLKRPVTIDSLLAPPNGSLASTKGNLAVLVTDQAGAPVAGVPVSIPGKSGVTDSNGCVFFGLITAGQYTATIGTKTGYVEPGGNPTASKTATVSIGATSLIQQSYALAATVNVTVQAPVYGTVKASAARTTTFTNAILPPSGTKQFSASPATSSTLTANNLYPFIDGYTVYAGTCAANNPSPGAGPFTATPGPGGTASVTVRQSALNLTTVPPNGVTVSNPTANLYGIGSGCPTIKDLPIVNNKLVDSGVPGGTYDVCVDGTVTIPGQGTQQYHITVPAVAITDYASGKSLTIDANTSQSQPGLCA
jgi:Tfp pilus assembly protein PilV